MLVILQYLTTYSSSSHRVLGSEDFIRLGREGPRRAQNRRLLKSEPEGRLTGQGGRDARVDRRRRSDQKTDMRQDIPAALPP